jgi:hypothetical protein
MQSQTVCIQQRGFLQADAPSYVGPCPPLQALVSQVESGIQGVMQGYLVGLTVKVGVGVGARCRQSQERTAMLQQAIISETASHGRSCWARDTLHCLQGVGYRIEPVEEAVVKQTRYFELVSVKTNINYPYNKPANALRLRVGEEGLELHLLWKRSETKL